MKALSLTGIALKGWGQDIGKKKGLFLKYKYEGIL